MAILNVLDFMSPVDDERDLVPALRRLADALEDGDEIQFPAGEWELLPEAALEAALPITNHDLCVRSLGFYLEDKHQITINGNGCTLFAHGIISPIWLQACRDISIKNLHVDRRNPFDGNGRITNVGDGFFEIELAPESNPDYFVHNGILTFQGNGWRQPLEQVFEFDSKENIPAAQSADNLGGDWQVQWQVKDLGKNQLRISGTYEHQPSVGNIVVLRCAKRYCPGLSMSHCENIQCEGVHIYACGGMAFIAQRTRNITLSHCHVTPNPRGTRVDAACFDASHFANCAGQITVEHCTFHNQLDDPVNCHGAYFPVVRVIDEHCLRVALRHPQQAGAPVAQSGDLVALVRESNLERYWQAPVSDVHIVNHQCVDLYFDDALPDDVAVDDALDNISWYPDLTIRNCHFKGNRARGPLISTSGKVLVEDNYLNIPGAAILVVGGLDSWCESGPVKDVTIRNNHFDRCAYNAPIWGDAIIHLHCHAKDIASRTEAFHKNIRIEGNTFDTIHDRIISTRSVSGLSATDNTINALNGAAIIKWLHFSEFDEIFADNNTINQ